MCLMHGTASWCHSRGHSCYWRDADLSWTAKDSPVSSRGFHFPLLPPPGQRQANKVSGKRSLRYRLEMGGGEWN